MHLHLLYGSYQILAQGMITVIISRSYPHYINPAHDNWETIWKQETRWKS